MNRPTIRHRLGSIFSGSLILGLALMQGGCTNNESMFEPIASETPTDGPFVTGVVETGAGVALEGAVVTLEPMKDGMTVALQEALSGKRTVEPTAATDAGGQRGRITGDGLRATVTNVDGGYVFGSVSPGEYLLTGRTEDHLAGTARAIIRSTAAETTVVDIELTPTGDVYGVVTLENATNHQSSIAYVEGTSYAAVTDPFGLYAIYGVPVGTWTVRSTHPGYIDDSESAIIAAAGDSIVLPNIHLLLDSNIAPVATANLPINLHAGAQTNFSGSGSDDDGTIVLYEWDFEDDGVFDFSDGASAITTHTYATAGEYTAKLRVTDDDGAFGLDAVTFTVVGPIFVSAGSGSDANPGTAASPKATIGAGLTAADVGGHQSVIVATGTYTESPSFINGISVFGGYDDGTWARLPGQYSVVSVDTAHANVFFVDSLTTFEGLDFQSSDEVEANAASFAVRIFGGAPVFVDCRFQSANGVDGFDGFNGSSGTAGNNGAPGQPGSCDDQHGNGGTGGTSAAGCPGGSGGRGGLDSSPGHGVSGTTGVCSGGGGGGFGSGGDPGNDGQDGDPGLNGSNGNTGSGGNSTGSILGGSVWTPSGGTNGLNGSPGRGGGGGGGGGAQIGTFVDNGGGNGGGGGGGGGQGGTRGTRGTGGTGSFAVFVLNSVPKFIDCTFTSGNGGDGGDGGNGADGAQGGFGGAGATVCSSEIGEGGDGGDGGDGGYGGGGGGGGGGPSYGLYLHNSIANLSNPTFSIGSGGAGGLGGQSGSTGPTAQNGANGATGPTGP